MKTKLIILGLLISCAGFGQVFSLDQPDSVKYIYTNVFNLDNPLYFQASVSAGPDDTITAGQTYQLAGAKAYMDSVVWTTSGTGTFNNDNSLTAVYTPSAADVAAGSVTLTLTGYVNGLSAGDGMVLTLLYNAVAEALFARMTIEPIDSRKRLISDFIDSLQYQNIYDSIDIMYVFADPYLDNTLLQWKGNAFNLTTVQYPVFRADTGWAGSGTLGMLTSGYNPSEDSIYYSQDLASMYVYNRSNDFTNGRTILGNAATNRAEITILTSQIRGRLNNTTAASAIVNHGNNILGLLGVVRKGTNLKVTRGSTALISSTVASSDISEANINIVNGGGAASYLGTVSFVAIGNLQRYWVLNRIVEWYMDSLNIGVQ